MKIDRRSGAYSGAPIDVERRRNSYVAFPSRRRHLARPSRLRVNWRTAVVPIVLQSLGPDNLSDTVCNREEAVKA